MVESHAYPAHAQCEQLHSVNSKKKLLYYTTDFSLAHFTMELKGKDEKAVRLWLLNEGFKESLADCFECKWFTTT